MDKKNLIIFLAIYIILTSDWVLFPVSCGALKLSALPCFRDFGPVQVSALPSLPDYRFCWASLDPSSLPIRLLMATPGARLDLPDASLGRVFTRPALFQSHP